MKLPGQTAQLMPRLLMFLVLGGITLYITHFTLPGNLETIIPDIAFNPLAEIMVFAVLTLGGLLVAFWITFGDLINRGEK